MCRRVAWPELAPGEDLRRTCFDGECAVGFVHSRSRTRRHTRGRRPTIWHRATGKASPRARDARVPLRCRRPARRRESASAQPPVAFRDDAFLVGKRRDLLSTSPSRRIGFTRRSSDHNPRRQRHAHQVEQDHEPPEMSAAGRGRGQLLPCSVLRRAGHLQWEVQTATPLAA